MSLKDWVISILALVALGVGVTAYTMRQTTPPVGGISTNQPTEPFYFQGGFTGKRAAFVSTTTVACLVQNPTTATTTFSVRWDVPTATTTTTVLAISTSTNSGRYATTTAIQSKTLSASAKGSDSWIGANSNNILGPGEWVQVGYGAGTTLPLVAQQQTGTCSVLFTNIY